MRAVSERRAVIEYARVHHIVGAGQLMPVDADFPSTILERLRWAEGLPALWWGRSWRLGNIERIITSDYPEAAQLPISTVITGRHGWAEEVESGELAPRYDENQHSWQVEPLVRLEGAVGIFVLDTSSRVMAITNYSGRDLSLPGFCNTMTELLNTAERERRRRSETVASAEWLVEPLEEKGTFAQWLTTVEVVRKITANFHLPNPSPREILEPAFDLLDKSNSTKSRITLESSKPGGLNPNGHPLVQGAVAMQEADYGELSAEGVEPSGEDSRYNSRDHRARDTVEEPQVSVSGLTVMLLRLLVSRIERRARERGEP